MTNSFQDTESGEKRQWSQKNKKQNESHTASAYWEYVQAI